MTKKQYFVKLNVKDVADNKMIWKNVKLHFSDKSSNSANITLVQKDMIITDEKQIASIMSEHFVSITKKLSLKPSISSKDSNSDFFHDHISIKKIKEIYPEIVPNSFKFEPVTKDDIKNEIQNLNVKKSSTFGCIPVTILKDCIDVYLVHLTNSVNHSLQTSVFPQKLKQADMPYMWNLYFINIPGSFSDVCKITKLKSINKKGKKDRPFQLQTYFFISSHF